MTTTITITIHWSINQFRSLLRIHKNQIRWSDDFPWTTAKAHLIFCVFWRSGTNVVCNYEALAIGWLYVSWVYWFDGMIRPFEWLGVASSYIEKGASRTLCSVCFEERKQAKTLPWKIIVWLLQLHRVSKWLTFLRLWYESAPDANTAACCRRCLCWLVGWLIDWLVDWVNDWLIELRCCSSVCSISRLEWSCVN